MDGILVEQPKTKEARQEVATMCANNLNLTLPILLDKIDDRTARAYSAFPDRIYVVTADSRVAYKGQPGPRGFDVNEAKNALQTALNGKITKYNGAPNRRREDGIGRRSRRTEGRIRTPGSTPTMGVMDTNKDGNISGNEWIGEIETFDRLDRNNDSILSRNEIQVNPRQARFRLLDKNNDKQISRNEWSRNTEFFEILDKDADGFITLEEFRRGPGGG